MVAARCDSTRSVATHDSYWIHRDPVDELFASGTQERLLDQLLFEHVRGLEIDVHHDDAPHAFAVARITVTSRVGGQDTVTAADVAARTASGPGDLLRMVVCTAGGQTTATAFAAARVLPGGAPDWVQVGAAGFSGPIGYQGLRATGDVLFTGTLHDVAYVSRYDLSQPVAGTLTDLSDPSPTPGCHDPQYPAGCRAPR